jgi:hypothetical protein
MCYDYPALGHILLVLVTPCVAIALFLFIKKVKASFHDGRKQHSRQLVR